MPLILRFVTCADAVSDGIRLFEYGYWATHVECLMPDGTLLGAHADGGVMARPHDYDKGQFTRELYLPVEGSQEQVDAFHAFLRSQVGKPYDFLAIAGIVAQRNWQSANAWFCSELIAAGLCKVGIFPDHLATEFNHVTPRDVLLIISGRVPVAA